MKDTSLTLQLTGWKDHLTSQAINIVNGNTFGIGSALEKKYIPNEHRKYLSVEKK